MSGVDSQLPKTVSNYRTTNWKNFVAEFVNYFSKWRENSSCRRCIEIIENLEKFISRSHQFFQF